MLSFCSLVYIQVEFTYYAIRSDVAGGYWSLVSWYLKWDVHLEEWPESNSNWKLKLDSLKNRFVVCNLVLQARSIDWDFLCGCFLIRLFGFCELVPIIKFMYFSLWPRQALYLWWKISAFPQLLPYHYQNHEFACWQSVSALLFCDEKKWTWN
jgi:hypothetical protein